LARRALLDPVVTKRLVDFWGLSRVITPLAVTHPQNAADLFIEAVRVALEQKSKIDLARQLSDLLGALATAPPDAVAPAFRILIPTISNAEFPGEFSPQGGIERTVNGQAVSTRNAHETSLFRFGVFMHALAPDVYEASLPLFERWAAAIRSVDSREKLRIFRGGPPGWGPPIPIYMRVSADEAFALVETTTKLEDQIAALENLALRDDFTPDQHDKAVERARVAVRSDLTAALAKPDRDSVTVNMIARNLRWAGIQFESDDPSLQAKLALIDLEDAVQPTFDFALPDPDGIIRRLSDYRGKVVLINFWATWCPPCRAERPVFSKLQRDWGPKGLTILAISDESVETVVGYEKQFRTRIPVLLDPTRKVFDHYRVQGIPDTRILDRSGRVVASFGELVSEEELVRSLQKAGLK
jgi:thiol-disulfide isomerase/thioredoxin